MAAPCRLRGLGTAAAAEGAAVASVPFAGWRVVEGEQWQEGNRRVLSDDDVAQSVTQCKKTVSRTL